MNVDKLQTDVLRMYEKIKFWRSNLFEIPGNKSGKELVRVMNCWIDQFIKSTPLSTIAIHVFMILSNLILQKPNTKIKGSKGYCQLVERRMKMWIDGQVTELMRECEVIQTRLRNKAANKDSSFETLFCRFVLQGRLTSATRLLENSSSKGPIGGTVLAMTPNTREH